MFHHDDTIRSMDESIPRFSIYESCRAGDFLDVLLNAHLCIPDDMLQELHEMMVRLRIPFRYHPTQNQQHKEEEEEEQDYKKKEIIGIEGVRLGPYILSIRGDRARLLLRYLVSYHEDEEKKRRDMPSLFKLCIGRCMVRSEAQHWLREPQLSDIHCICNRDYVAPLQKSTTVSSILTPIQFRAAFYFFHKWRCIDLNVTYELWQPFLKLHWRTVSPTSPYYDIYRTSSAFPSPAMLRDRYEGLPHIQMWQSQFGSLLDKFRQEMDIFMSALEKFQQGQAPIQSDHLFSFFLWDLMPYLQTIDQDYREHLQMVTSTTQQEMKWFETRELSMYEAVAHLVDLSELDSAQALYHSKGINNNKEKEKEKEKIKNNKRTQQEESQKMDEDDNPKEQEGEEQQQPRLIIGITQDQLDTPSTQIWDPVRRCWTCIVSTTKSNWRCCMFYQYYNLAIDLTLRTHYWFYWFAPHVFDRPNQRWHTWRCLLTRQSDTDPRSIAYSQQAWQWCRTLFCKFAQGHFKPAHLPMYEVILAGPNHLDWNQTPSIIQQKLPGIQQDLSILWSPPTPMSEAALAFLASKIIKIAPTSPPPPPISPTLLAQDPLLISSSSSSYPRHRREEKEGDAGWFELLMALEYRARRLPGITYDQPIGLTYTSWHENQLDTPLVFSPRQGVWCGLSSPQQGRLLLPWETNDSMIMSPFFAKFIGQ
jgi:hypothetical protein